MRYQIITTILLFHSAFALYILGEQCTVTVTFDTICPVLNFNDQCLPWDVSKCRIVTERNIVPFRCETYTSCTKPTATTKTTSTVPTTTATPSQTPTTTTTTTRPSTRSTITITTTTSSITSTTTTPSTTTTSSTPTTPPTTTTTSTRRSTTPTPSTTTITTTTTARTTTTATSTTTTTTPTSTTTTAAAQTTTARLTTTTTDLQAMSIKMFKCHDPPRICFKEMLWSDDCFLYGDSCDLCHTDSCEIIAIVHETMCLTINCKVDPHPDPVRPDTKLISILLPIVIIAVIVALLFVGWIVKRHRRGTITETSNEAELTSTGDQQFENIPLQERPVAADIETTVQMSWWRFMLCQNGQDRDGYVDISV